MYVAISRKTKKCRNNFKEQKENKLKTKIIRLKMQKKKKSIWNRENK